MQERFELVYWSRPWTFNAERSFKHWSQRDKLTVEWRTAFKFLCLEAKAPRLLLARIEVQQFYSNKGRPPDPMACAGAAKAAIDGVVDAGVLRDDAGKYLKAVEFLAPEKAERDGLMLVVEDLEYPVDV